LTKELPKGNGLGTRVRCCKLEQLIALGASLILFSKNSNVVCQRYNSQDFPSAAMGGKRISRAKKKRLRRGGVLAKALKMEPEKHPSKYAWSIFTSLMT
jgi:hypothetical protein